MSCLWAPSEHKRLFRKCLEKFETKTTDYINFSDQTSKIYAVCFLLRSAIAPWSNQKTEKRTPDKSRNFSAIVLFFEACEM